MKNKRMTLKQKQAETERIAQEHVMPAIQKHLLRKQFNFYTLKTFLDNQITRYGDRQLEFCLAYLVEEGWLTVAKSDTTGYPIEWILEE